MLLFFFCTTRTNHHNTVITRDKYSCEIPFDQIKLTDGDLVLDEDGLDVSICIRFIITDKLKKNINDNNNIYIATSIIIIIIS